MARISVVVPIYNVERYLAACLHSVARQTVDDLEVVMVDDGSTDGSAAIAAEFAARDPRFRLLRQPNGGLGNARNTGTDAASGEYLAFLDSDDVLPSDAYELLLGALSRTGSDFATGNVHRLTGAVTSQAAFLAKAFRRTRLKTHVTRFRPLISDRTAWNKLWRRSFWDEHALRFPEGVVHEDIPVVLPAHFMARSVDVIGSPVYRYRTREDGERSITQQRAERRVLLDRLAAVEYVRGYLAANGPRRARRWYDERLVADDLRLHLDVLGEADDAYRTLFVDRVNALLAAARPDVFDQLAAIDRLKWHLVRRRLLPELLEVLRFQREEHGRSRPVRIRGRWYGDYPFRDDALLAIPRSTYRLGRSDPDLALNPHLDGIEREGDGIRLSGRACIVALGAPSPRFQRVQILAARPGRFQRLRLRLGAVRLDTIATQWPAAAIAPADGSEPPSWSGFEARLDPRALCRAGRWVEGTWELSAFVRAGGLRRRRSRFLVEDPRVERAVDLPAPPEISVRAVATSAGTVRIHVRRSWASLTTHAAERRVLRLAGSLVLPARSDCVLELRRTSDGFTLSYPVTVDWSVVPATFAAAVPLPHLRDAPPPRHADDGYRVWELRITGADSRLVVGFADVLAGASWVTEAGETSVLRTARGDAALVEERAGVPLAQRSEADRELALP